MVEEQRKRIENEMSKVVEELDRNYLRTMQGDMHRCAATCCDNKTLTMQSLNRCVENCGTTVNKAQNYVQGELTRVQNRLQRCVMDCNDKLRDKLGPNPTQNEINKTTDEFETCATKCVDNYCDLLPALESSMKKVLASKKFE